MKILHKTTGEVLVEVPGDTLRGANLTRANLAGAILRDANLDLGKAYPPRRITPEEGSFIAWKKASGRLVKLLIPADAERVGGLVGRKCRASQVEVLGVYAASQAASNYDPSKVYKKGETVYPDSYDADPRAECSHGIHFFMSRQEAEEF